MEPGGEPGVGPVLAWVALIVGNSLAFVWGLKIAEHLDFTPMAGFVAVGGALVIGFGTLCCIDRLRR